jgi:hypothetical protein
VLEDLAVDGDRAKLSPVDPGLHRAPHPSPCMRQASARTPTTQRLASAVRLPGSRDRGFEGPRPLTLIAMTALALSCRRRRPTPSYTIRGRTQGCQPRLPTRPARHPARASGCGSRTPASSRRQRAFAHAGPAAPSATASSHAERRAGPPFPHRCHKDARATRSLPERYPPKGSRARPELAVSEPFEWLLILGPWLTCQAVVGNATRT